MKALLLAALFAAAVLAAQLAGNFRGDWSSNSSGAAGAIQLNVKPGADAVQNSEASFTLSGTTIKTRVRSLVVEGSNLEMSYEFDVQGTALVSKLKGKLDGDTLAGTYETTVSGGNERVDEGKFKTTLAK